MFGKAGRQRKRRERVREAVSREMNELRHEYRQAVEGGAVQAGAGDRGDLILPPCGVRQSAKLAGGKHNATKSRGLPQQWWQVERWQAVQGAGRHRQEWPNALGSLILLPSFLVVV